MERLYKLLDVVRDLSATQDFDSYLQKILSHATEMTESETASILEYDPQTKELCFTVVPWFHRDLLKGVKIPVDKSAAGWVVREMKPLTIVDVKQDARYFPVADRLSHFQTRSLLAVPLVLREKAIGVIEVLNKTGSTDYTEEDTRILETLATLAALAIHDHTLENRLQTSDQEFVELDRLKSDFIAITSHELRTPLGLILGHATFLRELVDEEFHEQLDAIVRNATKLKDIIESLSNVDNYQTGAARIRQRKVSVARILEDVVSSFSEMASQKQVEMKVEMDKDDLLVEGDGGKITIAMSNLVKNAITFTDGGGHVLVRAEAVPNNVKVSVIDDGVGIPLKDQPRVFERFFQVESHLTRKHGGMGLGLSVAKVMIEMHGGRIWVESAEGKGSAFIFLLPVEAAQPKVVTQAFTD